MALGDLQAMREVLYMPPLTLTVALAEDRGVGSTPWLHLPQGHTATHAHRSTQPRTLTLNLQDEVLHGELKARVQGRRPFPEPTLLLTFPVIPRFPIIAYLVHP